VLRTRVGYAGGTTPSPTYHDLGDHSEALEIDFDPTVTSYAALVDVFFQSHNPCSSPWSRQYRSAAFPRDAQQRAALEAGAARAGATRGKEVRTALEDFTGFTLAEDYHQKYRLRHVGAAAREFEGMFPTTEAFVGSVAVTKANAIAAGYGTTRELRDELGRLGLSESAQRALRDAAR